MTKHAKSILTVRMEHRTLGEVYCQSLGPIAPPVVVVPSKSSAVERPPWLIAVFKAMISPTHIEWQLLVVFQGSLRTAASDSLHLQQWALMRFLLSDRA